MPPTVTVDETNLTGRACAVGFIFWADVGGERLLREIRSSIRFRIDSLFRENGIVIAFPQRDIHMNTANPLEVRMVEAER